MPTNANYEVPNLEESIVDGIAINPQGALSGQALVYDNFTNSFIPGSASGNLTGFLTTGQIAYAVGTQNLTTASGVGASNFVWDDTDGYLGIGTSSPSYHLHTVGDGYFTSRLIINGSSAAVGPSGAGAIRYNPGTNHLEFSENGGAWSQLGSTGTAIGSTVTGGTSKSILFVDGSNQLAQDNSNFVWDYANSRLGIGTGSPDAKIHVLQQAFTSGAPIIAHLVGGAHTALPAATEVLDVYANLSRTVQLTGGNYATQRAFFITAPTYSFTSATTVTNTATLAVAGAPSGGTNATLTNRYSIWAQSGIAAFDEHVKVDGYLIDLSGGAVTNQVLAYNGTKFVAVNAASQGGTTSATNIPYASSSNTLSDTAISWNNSTKTATVTTISGNNGYTVTDGTRTIALGVTSTVGQLGTTSNNNLAFYTNNSAAQMTLSTGGQLGIGASPSYALHVAGDGYVTSREIIAASSAAVSPSGTGAFRFNTATSHLEFSESGGSWQQIASATSANMAIGNSVTSGTSGSILYIDASSNLAQDNANFFWDATNHRLGIGNTSPSFPIHVKKSDTSGTGVQYRVTNTSTTTASYATASFEANNGTVISQVYSDGLGTGPLGAAGFYVGTFTGHPMGFFTSNAERARILSGGGMAINRTTIRDSAQLDVGGTAVFGSDTGGTVPAAVFNTGSGGIPFVQFKINDGTTLAQIIGYNGTSFGLVNGLTIDLPSSASFGIRSGSNTNVYKIDTSGNTTVSQVAATSGASVGYKFNGAAHTNLTASAENVDINFALNRTVQFTAGSLTTQRAFLIQAPTYTFTGPTTLANAATFAVAAAPSAGANATITNAYSMWVQSGLAAFDGHIKVDGYKIDLSSGAANTQVLAYNGTAFVPTNANSGSIGGSIAANQVAYGSGANTIQGSANLTYDGTTLAVAGHLSVDGYTIDISAGAANGQALVYNSVSNKFVAQTVSGGGGGGSSIGTSGQKFITHVPAAFNANNGTATPLTIGGFSFTPTNYSLSGTTQTVEFRAIAACGNTTVTGHVKLRDVTNGVDIVTLNITGTADTTYTQALTISSAGSNTISSSTAIYEVSIYVDNPLALTDFIQLYMSELRNINTIN